MTARDARRRSWRSSAAGLAAALLVTAPVAAAAGQGTAATAEVPTPLHATSVRLAEVADTAVERPGVFRTPRLRTAPYKMLAVTWRGRAGPTLQVRVRSQRRWEPWRELHVLAGHAPDRGTTEARQASARSGSELMWVGRSTGVQLRLRGDTGRDARLVLLDPGVRPTDTEEIPGPVAKPAAAPTGALTSAVEIGDAPQPRIRPRSAWGADESWRTGDPVYLKRIKQAHIHHTAASNDYSRADVPAIIRGDYWYHTQQLGWSDLGYNFVVDRFGRIWAGRAGGVKRAVRGAHTLGFNHASFGVAAIGNLETARPSSALVTALVRLTAWKLDSHDRRPSGYAWVRSQGSDRYPAGARVRLPNIDGHRDTNQTACPGDLLYAKLPDIRRRAQERADGIYPPG